MAALRDEAICIRHWDFSETSQTVSLFGREHGLIRGLAKGAKRERGRFSGGIELLTRGEVLAIVKAGRGLATLTDWDLLEIFPGLTRDLAAYHAALYAADLVPHLLAESDPHPRLHDALVHLLRELGGTSAAAAAGAEGEAAAPPPRRDALLLRYQWILLEETGYRPELDQDLELGAAIDLDESEPDETMAFSPSAGGLVADSGEPDRWRVRISTLRRLRRLASDPEGDATPTGEDGEATERAARLLAAYLRWVLDREPATMRWVFGPLRT